MCLQTSGDRHEYHRAKGVRGQPPGTSQPSSHRVLTSHSYLQSLESRVYQLENSLSTVKDDLGRLSSRVSHGTGSEPISSEFDHNARQTTPLRDLAGTEDSVDAMGTITLANEEDSGFFGKTCASLSASLSCSPHKVPRRMLPLRVTYAEP